MSLSESYTDLSGKPQPPSQPDRLSADHPFVNAPPVDPKLFRLRESLAGILEIAGEAHAEQKRIGRVYIFKGDLKIPPETAYAAVSERFKPLGYTAMLQRDDGEDVVIAIEGELPMRRIKTRPLLHLLLLLVTMVTTTIMGAALTGMPTTAFVQAIRAWDLTVIKPAVRDSLPFSLTLLGILWGARNGALRRGAAARCQGDAAVFYPAAHPSFAGYDGRGDLHSQPAHEPPRAV